MLWSELMDVEKDAVRDFWDEASCGELLYLPGVTREEYDAQARTRYRLEPFIDDFARFEESEGLDVLEIGVGLGADHQRFAKSKSRLHGIDLTDRAIEHTRRRLDLFGLHSELRVGDAENLPWPDNSFDIVYSWGVLHHSPNTKEAIKQVWRVLRSGGEARVMIYYTWSLVGLMLWVRYALLTFRPWLSLTNIYAIHLESPGTKAYTISEAQKLFSAFSEVKIKTVLTHGDLLSSKAGQRHGGILLTMARLLWPRWLFRKFFPDNGLFMMITAVK